MSKHLEFTFSIYIALKDRAVLQISSNIRSVLQVSHRLGERHITTSSRWIITGDFNIAPLATDVWDVEYWKTNQPIIQMSMLVG